MRITANGLEFEVDEQGPADGEPLLMIMGLGMQLVAWPDELVADLAARGFRVLRMDNRDIGLSAHLDHLGTPNLLRASLRHLLRLKVRSPYALAAMAEDCVGVLDHLGIKRVHVCGASMGGMIAQHIAASHPERVKSLTLIMTSSGARHLPQAKAAVRRALLSRPRGDDTESRVVHALGVWRVIGSPGYPPDAARQRRRIESSIRRAWHPAGVARQLVAIVADGDRSSLLKQIVAPTRVIHGKDDPLVPVPAAHDLVKKIEHAVADIIPGMGHDLPEQLLPRVAAGIAENAGRSR
ncbi:alpha/beta fold hydrolase [Aquabacterium sp.]|uniref:alpha/beta fold hydrolase n=1 Tax=Aquabacterium sp. TaxID=1872578 RepID=UPI002C16D79A|nr:alpha/beta fold hydrolase [Aquabacterium sp.]HSW09185.1 alpha/beta fold hydrolase [Aquabacterium sp.]